MNIKENWEIDKMTENKEITPNTECNHLETEIIYISGSDQMLQFVVCKTCLKSLSNPEYINNPIEKKIELIKQGYVTISWDKILKE